MNDEQNLKTNDDSSQVEDLTINPDEAKDVKGGAQVDYFIKIRTLDGDVADHGYWSFEGDQECNSKRK